MNQYITIESFPPWREDKFQEKYKERIKENPHIDIASLYPKSFFVMPLSQQKLKPKIKNVIFNDPATIVFWTDGTRTVVKTQDGEIFDPEKGLAMAISKKALGNSREYYHTFLHWLKQYDRKYYWKTEKSNDNSSVQKAYDILVKARDGDIDYSTLLHPIEEAIGYLGEALED